MSNCIEFKPGHSCVVAFGQDMFTPAFFEDLEWALQHDPNSSPRPADNASEDEWRRYTMSWYLVKGQNVRLFKNGNMSITFGWGRSMHTWRDFAGTCYAIAHYFKQPAPKAWEHRFYINDTGFDRPGQYGYFDVDFANLDKAFK